MTYPVYHRTTDLSVREYAERISQAAKQADYVLAVFGRGTPMTPSTVHNILTRMGKKLPITSVRRAITGLEKGGKLRKSRQLVRGPHAHLENCWEIVK